MNRLDKIRKVSDFLKQERDEKILNINHIKFSSENISDMLPNDILDVLLLLSYQPNCLKFNYKNRYKNEEAIEQDDELYREIVVNASEMTEIPNFYEYSIRQCLSIIDFEVELLDEFENSLNAVLNNKVHIGKSNDSIALELKIIENNVIVRIVEDGNKEYPPISNIGKGVILPQIMEYAEKHQNQPFVITDIVQTKYNNNTFLNRVPKDKMLIDSFFKY